MSQVVKAKSNHSAQSPVVGQSFTLFQGDTPFGQKVVQVLNSDAYTIFSTVIMIYTLFSDDIRSIFFPLSADQNFSIITLICIFYYFCQITVFSLFQKDYFLKYYFWLDIVSTFTMFFDLIWVTQYLTGGGKSAANVAQISKASRAARLGTRTVRLIRLIRLIKILKQMKQLSKDLGGKNQQIIKKNDQKKNSDRLNNMITKLKTLKDVQNGGSIRSMQKPPSKRWSLIKDVQSLGMPNGSKKQIQAGSLKAIAQKIQTRLENKDVIKDQQGQSVNNSKKKKKVMMFQNQPGSIQNIVSSKSAKQKMREITMKKSRFDLAKPVQVEDQNRQASMKQLQIPPESKVGIKVRDEIQKNVITMIILILICIPLLDGATWFNNTSVYDNAQQQLLFFAANYPAQYDKVAKLFVKQAMTNNNPLIYFSIQLGSIKDVFPDNYPENKKSMQDIIANTRSDDLNIITSGACKFAYDISDYNKKSAIMNICRTLFVTALLITTTIFFSRDLQLAAIAPLEEMFDTVKKIAINPLNALRQIQQRRMCLESIQKEQGQTLNTEPKVLQNTIVKIGSLLAIGFGEAGTQIISKVIEDPSIIDVMIPGQKIMALFGFCDIRNFTDATQVLQADVMVFVNEIAAICHKVTYQNLGSPNKNIGDAFLLVWKFNQEDVKTTQNQKQAVLEIIPTPRSKQKADLAVLALIKMISQITKSQCLQKYKNNRMLQERIPNYAGVKMGFGLHVGWAIEGPIGSEYKIDASYLGPDVHMASRLQAATKGYGTGMLITGAVYDLMTENKQYLRCIDRVIPDQNEPPTYLYTVDLIPKHLFEEVGIEAAKKLNEKQKKMAKLAQNIARKNLINDINKMGAVNGLWADDDFKIMQEQYTPKFYAQWKIGFDHYLNGKWQQAIEQLNLACSLAPGGFDGPSEGLIKYMKQFDGKCPVQWPGYRQFD